RPGPGHRQRRRPQHGRQRPGHRRRAMTADSRRAPEAAETSAQAGGTAPQPPGGGSRPAWLNGRALVHRLITASETWTLLALILMVAFFAIKAPGSFFNITNFSLIGQNSAWLLVMAVGQTFVILTAGIDLSVGSV